MDIAAIQTIRNYNRRWGKRAAEKFASKFINLINKKYPEGPDKNTYYVIPGFEQVTRDQPIVQFNETDGIWVLSSFTLFTHIQED